MSDIPPINSAASAASIRPPGKTEGPARNQGPAPATPPDRVEISEIGQRLSTLELDGDIRADKVMEIREAIADGTYETDVKLEYTISRLLEVLRSSE